ncbi:MAG: VWA domain-containing protein [Candidatus Aenigmarchaeota archaeon]|nr:VWA domain-containing protein [Candidatus Aenigmarchaeota archaeon]
MNTKILVSLLVIGLTAIAIGGTMTGAFFSDTETSTGNTFTAGEIDLTVDSECHYNGNECVDGTWQGGNDYPVPGTECECTWLAQDLNGQPILNFGDVKPGDYGESTISIHVTSNPAWVCAKISGLSNAENGCTEPEDEADGTCGDQGLGEGELQDVLSFDIWRDYDCENDFDVEIDEYLVQGAKATDLVWPIADALTGEPVQPGVNYCIAVAWSVPSETGNIIQTDSVMADISFEAIQQRHNENFLCVPGTEPVCGNGILEQGEECDDGNDVNDDECRNDCTLPGICAAAPDVMTVLDRSASIDTTEMNTMKNAAHAFVTALDPKTDGAHMGQTSFSTSGTLDLHLTSDKTAIDAAIDAVSPGGSTNLYEGILLANQELEDASYDRDDADSPDYMVIITDGEPNLPTSPDTPRNMAKAQADVADSRGTKIYVVGVGVSTDNADWLKANIATDSTYYFDAGNFNDLLEILEDLANCSNGD